MMRPYLPMHLVFFFLSSKETSCQVHNIIGICYYIFNHHCIKALRLMSGLSLHSLWIVSFCLASYLFSGLHIFHLRSLQKLVFRRF